MPTRDSAPIGAPCWTDLSTPDVDAARRFYAELFGWEAAEPSPEFGGYFMFLRDGVPVAGGMGPMGDDGFAANAWQVYLSTDDITKTLEAVEAEGGTVVSPAMAVADLGTQAILSDSTGAHLGTWQPGTFPGFTVLGEHASPSWFELHTRDHNGAVAFYRNAFRWDTRLEADTGEFHYTVMKDPRGEGELAGIMDASGFLPEGVPAHWSVYWEVDDIDARVAQVTALGGAVVTAAEDTPYGRLATVADSRGAQFKLRTGPTV